MLILIKDKNTNKIINNMGCLQGVDDELPPISLDENEEAIYLDEKSEYAKQIMSACEYDISVESDVVISVNVIKTKEQYKAEQPIVKSKLELAREELTKLDPANANGKLDIIIKYLGLGGVE